MVQAQGLESQQPSILTSYVKGIKARIVVNPVSNFLECFLGFGSATSLC